MMLAYFAERFRFTMFVPLAVIVATTAAGGRFGFTDVIADSLWALLLLLEFRLWDDLADRAADARRHPHRVLVRARSTTQARALCLVAGAANVAWCFAPGNHAISFWVLAILHLALAAWYRFRTRRTAAGDQLLLAKYPAFVFVIAGSRVATAPLVIAVGAAALYFAASVYEAWHDPVSPLNPLIGGRS